MDGPKATAFYIHFENLLQLISLVQCFSTFRGLGGLLPETVNTCGPLLINRVVQYHGRAIQ